MDILVSLDTATCHTIQVRGELTMRGNSVIDIALREREREEREESEERTKSILRGSRCNRRDSV